MALCAQALVPAHPTIALRPNMRYHFAVNTSTQHTAAAPDFSRDLAAMVEFLEGQRAEDVFVHVFSRPNPVCDGVIVATATSRRHAQGLADGLLRLCARRKNVHMEGYAGAQWILVDTNDIIIHILQPEARQLYALEDLCIEPEEKLPGE